MENSELKDFYIISYSTPEFNLPLFANQENEVGPKASILIGPNGSNKSRVLASLVEELTNIDGLRRELNEGGDAAQDSKSQFRPQNQELFPDARHRKSSLSVKGKNTQSSQATVKYRLGKDVWTIERNQRNLRVWQNSELVEPFTFPFPDKAIAVAHLPTDRFKFNRHHDDDFYIYLGLRQATNMTTTGALESKVVLSFIDAMQRVRAPAIFSNWLSDLRLGPSLKIEIGLDRRIYYETTIFEEFANEAMSRLEQFGGTRRPISEDRREETHRNLNAFWPFLCALREFPTRKRSSRLRYRPIAYSLAFDVDQMPDLFSEFDVAEMIKIGRSLRVISDTALVFTKSQYEVQFSELSSGEQQVLGTVIRSVAELGRNSVLVIDEPEVSLHPAWQRLYLPRLLETLSFFPETHVILATHSHFMVADLAEGKASLTVSTNEPGVRFQSFDGGVYGRSPENILYRVFGIATTSNFYVERDLTKALRIVSGVDDFDHQELVEIFGRLQVINEPDNEALIEILARIQIVLERGVD
ncbi:AAA domain-containing protein, putative AbiEii toxin, Type IV TA system [Yoonia tamlensis]|uniref:AAA domain-containing protein, putative AbiEii toxin, Type IV TA system n=1 Tax=Yoonia tamlensis TaxID=390270 RepID=A0A1I6FZ15_9RHOB|nr:AAA family ATPase [Yoonia tamlensis]SFR35077.1 AAA domain-containing protein, putative AbiEii toxin, Type IV TA system [Yoonia tamlensis]